MNHPTISGPLITKTIFPYRPSDLIFWVCWKSMRFTALSVSLVLPTIGCRPKPMGSPLPIYAHGCPPTPMGCPLKSMGCPYEPTNFDWLYHVLAGRYMNCGRYLSHARETSDVGHGKIGPKISNYNVKTFVTNDTTTLFIPNL